MANKLIDTSRQRRSQLYPLIWFEVDDVWVNIVDERCLHLWRPPLLRQSIFHGRASAGTSLAVDELFPYLLAHIVSIIVTIWHAKMEEE